jgi:carbonic anhydrase
LEQYLGEYYAYWGSQTYPPCYQGVEWFVVKHVIPVSSSAIKSLKRIQVWTIDPPPPPNSISRSLTETEPLEIFMSASHSIKR